MNKNRLKKLEKKIITNIVDDFYNYGNDLRAEGIRTIDAILEEMNGPIKREKRATELYGRLTNEELRKYDPGSYRLLDEERKENNRRQKKKNLNIKK